jgi:hypothetical protein
MKNFIIIFLFVIAFALTARAQKQTDIVLTAVLKSKDPEVVEYAAESILNKVKSEIERDGFTADEMSRFAVVVNTVVTDKQNTGQALLYTYDIRFSVTDLLLDKTYGSFTVQIGGTGKSEGQAMMDALRRLDLKKSRLADNIKSATGQIIQYYNTNCRAIIDKVNMYLAAKQYNEAFANIAFIPDINSLSCKNELNALYVKVYQQYTAYNCAQTVQEAQNAWNLDPTKNGAEKVLELLSGIQLSAACKTEVNKLIAEIKKKLLNDQFDEKAFRNKVFDSAVNIQRDMINASRDVAVAYYKSKLSDVYVFLH